VTEVRITWDEAAALRLLSPNHNRSIAAALDRVAAKLVVAMKKEAPVSKTYPVYSRKGATVPGGTRYAGDFPLRPSGYLRSSIHAFRLSDGSIIVGPTASYARYVVDGTLPHEIVSHGPWPLRNRATGQVFGRHVHHPGTLPNNFVARALHRVAGMPV
jgi:hypothetical protein